MKQLFFKIIVQGRRNKPKVATDRASQRQDPRQPNGVEPINVDDLPELSRQRTYPSPRPSQSPRLNQPLRTDQPLRSDQLSRPDQQSESQVPRSYVFSLWADSDQY